MHRRHSNRPDTRFTHSSTGSALTVIVGGAAWYGAGGAVATFIVPAAAIGTAGLVGGFFWEAIKTMPRFKKATATVGDQFEKALDKAEKHADDKERALLKGMADLVERKRPLFEKVANLRPEFGWAKRFLGKNDRKKKLLRQIAVVGLRGVGKTTISRSLADHLRVPFIQTERGERATPDFTPSKIRTSQDHSQQQKKSIDHLAALLRASPSVIEVETELGKLSEAWSLLDKQAITVFLNPDMEILQSARRSKEYELEDLSLFRQRADIAIEQIFGRDASETVSEIYKRLIRIPGAISD